jgi:hypothetical protein
MCVSFETVPALHIIQAIGKTRFAHNARTENFIKKSHDHFQARRTCGKRIRICGLHQVKIDYWYDQYNAGE